MASSPSRPLLGTTEHSQPLLGHFGPVITQDLIPGLRVTGPLSYVVQNISLDLWPLEWLQRQTACGVTWTMLDVEKFLSRTHVELNPNSPHGFCRVWDGAKSRGQGNTQWYGSVHACGKTVRAHKFSGVAILGLRPEFGQHLDHECHNTLCISCLRVLSKAENEALIRRPKKHHLELARYCGITVADVMGFPDDKVKSLLRLMGVGKQIEAGQRPGGVLYHEPKQRTH